MSEAGDWTGVVRPSRLLSLAPSIRVEEPILSMVATRRRPERRSGAIRPIARHAPLNSSISAISERIAGVMRTEVISKGTAIFSSISHPISVLGTPPFVHPFPSNSGAKAHRHHSPTPLR